MSLEIKSTLSFDLPTHLRQGVMERLQNARRRLEDLVRLLGDLPDEKIPVEWETVEWIGGPFDGLQRRVERWRVPNLPAHFEIPTHRAQIDFLNGSDADPNDSNGHAMQESGPFAVYVSVAKGDCFRYRFVGTRVAD